MLGMIENSKTHNNGNFSFTFLPTMWGRPHNNEKYREKNKMKYAIKIYNHNSNSVHITN
jgi:hypothetical protein